MENLIREIEQFYKRFNINTESTEEENVRKFKNSLSRILEKQIGDISLKNEFRDVFIKYTGIAYKDKKTVDCNTEIDFGQRGSMFDLSEANYIKFSETCIGKAFEEDIFNIMKYMQIILLMDKNIVPTAVKNTLFNEMNEIVEIFGINVNIVKDKNKYLLYPKGAKELDEKLVNDNLIWLKEYNKSREKFIDALRKYQNRDDIRNILDDLRLSFEMFIQEVVGNAKSLENNKSDVGVILKDKNINVEISNMYMHLFNCYTNYQNNNVKHAQNCTYEEVEFMIYLTGSFMRLLISII